MWSIPRPGSILYFSRIFLTKFVMWWYPMSNNLFVISVCPCCLFLKTHHVGNNVRNSSQKYLAARASWSRTRWSVNRWLSSNLGKDFLYFLSRAFCLWIFRSIIFLTEAVHRPHRKTEGVGYMADKISGVFVPVHRPHRKTEGKVFQGSLRWLFFL